jgi:hypothetical protein
MSLNTSLTMVEVNGLKIRNCLLIYRNSTQMRLAIFGLIQFGKKKE